MLTHSQIWAAIDALASRFDLSASGLAKKAGLDPTSFNKSKRKTADGKERWPSTESLAKILQATQVSLDDFVDLVTQESETSYYQKLSEIGGCSPVVNMGGFQEEQALPLRPESIDKVGTPVSGFEDKDTFAFTLPDDVMEPFYRAGDTVIASPNAELEDGDRVLIHFRNGHVILAVLENKGIAQIDILKLEYGIEKVSYQNAELSTVAKVLWVQHG